MTLRIVFLGTPTFSVPCLQALLAAPDVSVLGVVTQPDRPAGRGHQLTASPVKLLAQAVGLPVFQPKALRKNADTLAWLRAQAPDFLVTIAFGQILSQEALDIPRLGTVNVHASLLPAYRGANPIQRAVMAGETQTGLTTMLTDAGVDTGAMLLRATTPIGPDDTTGDLHDRLSQMAGDVLLDTLRALATGNLVPTPQDPAQATHAPKCEKADSLIDWSMPSQALHNRIRGLQPWPGATTTLDGQIIKILRTHRPEPRDHNSLAPEAITAALPGAILGGAASMLWVRTGEGVLGIAQLQPAGKKPMAGVDWARGALNKRPENAPVAMFI